MSEALPPGAAARLPLASRLIKALMLAPITVYRWTLSPLLGLNCRHLPSCSDYASEAIDRNGAWKGGWLALARLCRCHPWGSHGFDPVPDVRQEHHTFAPWRYGRWSGPTNPRDGAAESR
jgi:putative membrane protein insertion efficiency factor